MTLQVRHTEPILCIDIEDIQSNEIIKYSGGRLIVRIYLIKFNVSHETAGTDDDCVGGVDVGVVLGDLGVVGLVVLVRVTVGQLWRGGGLSQPGPVAAVVVTSHRAAVALLGTQGGDVLVVVGTCQISPENSQSLEIFWSADSDLLSR